MNIGIDRNYDFPSNYWTAEADEALENEAAEQVLSKLEDHEPEYDNDLMDMFWCAEGGLKEEIENVFRDIAMLHLKKQHRAKIATGSALDEIFEVFKKREQDIILENT